MKLSKTILTLATTAFVVTGFFAVPVAVVHADDTVDQTNTNTGPDSINKNKVKIKHKNKVTKKNKATVHNAGTITSNTGGNVAKGNTESGDVKSGDVTVGADVTNDVNQNVADADCCCGVAEASDATVTQTNDTTGPDSINKNKVKIVNKNECKAINKANVTNVLTVNSNTGENKSKHNTVGGDVDSGDVSVTISFTNTVN